MCIWFHDFGNDFVIYTYIFIHCANTRIFCTYLYLTIVCTYVLCIMYIAPHSMWGAGSVSLCRHHAHTHSFSSLSLHPSRCLLLPLFHPHIYFVSSFFRTTFFVLHDHTQSWSSVAHLILDHTCRTDFIIYISSLPADDMVPAYICIYTCIYTYIYHRHICIMYIYI